MSLEAKDERIMKVNNRIAAPLYALILVMTFLVAIIKLLFITQDIVDFILEIVAVFGSIGYVCIRLAAIQVPLFTKSDEIISEIQNRYRAHGFYICFATFVFGEFILMFVFDKVLITALYILVWSVPSIIYTVLVIKKGVFILGSKRTEKSSMSSFKKRVVIGSGFFGIVCGWSFLFKDGSFQPMGLLAVAGMAVGWGIPFYFIMKAMIKKSESIADKKVKEAEKATETNL